MAQGYVRADTENNISNGEFIDATVFDAEYDAIQAAFAAQTGHSHDGTSGNGGPITKVGPAQEITVGTNLVEPKISSVMDLGSSTKKFKDAYFSGTLQATTINGNVTSAGNSEFGKLYATAGGTSPAYSFRDATDVGFHYFSGSGYLSLMKGGSSRLQVNETEIKAVNGAIFTGDGSKLTNIPGSAIIGDVPSGGVSGDYPNLTGTGVLTSGSIASGFGNINIGTKTFTGNGSGLNSLNASQLSGGTVPAERISSSINYGVGNLTAKEVVFWNFTSNNGSATNPSWSFTGDSDTGFYKQDNNTVSFTANGSERLRMSSTIKAIGSTYFEGSGAGLTTIPWTGIDGTLPNNKLSGTYTFDVLRLATGTAADPSFAFQSDNNMGMYRSNNNELSFSTNGIQRVVITSGGNLLTGNVTSSGVFTGDGSGLTNLNADNIASGTLSTSRMSTTTNARNWTLDRISESPIGAVGTYAFLSQATATATNITAGTTYAGSGLRYAGFHGTGEDASTWFTTNLGSTPSGTWMAMGTVTKSGSEIRATLFLRVS